jgi:hypothetical protein
VPETVRSFLFALGGGVLITFSYRSGLWNRDAGFAHGPRQPTSWRLALSLGVGAVIIVWVILVIWPPK